MNIRVERFDLKIYRNLFTDEFNEWIDRFYGERSSLEFVTTADLKSRLEGIVSRDEITHFFYRNPGMEQSNVGWKPCIGAQLVYDPKNKEPYKNKEDLPIQARTTFIDGIPIGTVPFE